MSGYGFASNLGNTAADLFLTKGIPYLGKKVVEMGRYYTSEMLRDPKLQQKPLTMLWISLIQLFIMLEHKLGINCQQKSDHRKDLDGSGFDLHKAIGKLPRPQSGFTFPGHKYTGPYNPLEQQLKYDPKTGEILEIYDKPTGPTDAIAMQHDVDYSVCKNDRKCKNKADRKMVQALDNVPYNERQWGHCLARNVINTKQNLGLGVKLKNVKGRRVKKTGKKN